MQAVRFGDLAVTPRWFRNTPRVFNWTNTLISRLAHQVVKAGLRKLHISQSSSLPVLRIDWVCPVPNRLEFVG
jgi:hypothetical protein